MFLVDYFALKGPKPRLCILGILGKYEIIIHIYHE